MNISLPETLKSFVDQQVSQGGYSISSEYLRELIRKDQDRLRLRDLLLSGGASASGAPVNANYLESHHTSSVKLAPAQQKGMSMRFVVVFCTDVLGFGSCSSQNAPVFMMTS